MVAMPAVGKAQSPERRAQADNLKAKAQQLKVEHGATTGIPCPHGINIGDEAWYVWILKVREGVDLKQSAKSSGKRSTVPAEGAKNSSERQAQLHAFLVQHNLPKHDTVPCPVGMHVGDEAWRRWLLNCKQGVNLHGSARGVSRNIRIKERAESQEVEEATATTSAAAIEGAPTEQAPPLSPHAGQVHPRSD